jgi:hypothetical protein
MEKMKVTSLAELVIIAERLGVLRGGSTAAEEGQVRLKDPHRGNDK